MGDSSELKKVQYLGPSSEILIQYQQFSPISIKDRLFGLNQKHSKENKEQQLQYVQLCRTTEGG